MTKLTLTASALCLAASMTATACDLHDGYGFGGFSPKHGPGGSMPNLSLVKPASRIEMSHPFAKSVKQGKSTDFNVGYFLPAGYTDAKMNIVGGESITLEGQDAVDLDSARGVVNVVFVAADAGISEIKLNIEALHKGKPVSLIRTVKIRVSA